MSSTNEEIRKAVENYQRLVAEGNDKEASEVFKALLSHDQLLQSRNVNEYLALYKEGEITFLPTYKYDPNSDKFDTSKKQRSPAW